MPIKTQPYTKADYLDALNQELAYIDWQLKNNAPSLAREALKFTHHNKKLQAVIRRELTKRKGKQIQEACLLEKIYTKTLNLPLKIY